jgi:glyoxylase-like metal-dependent hydrolase (beta-lactamase superfamily II)
MKVFILDTGTLHCDRDMFVIEEGTSYKPKPENETVRIPTPVFAVLIKHESGTLLFDTGCNSRAMEGYWPEHLRTSFPVSISPEQELTHQLSLCDTKPEDISTVLISHMHLDHAGNIRMFPNADIYIGRRDYEYGKALISEPDVRKHGAYIAEDFNFPPERLHLIESEFSIMDGVEIVSLPGHAPEVLGLIVHLKNRVLIFPQDSIYTPDNFEPAGKASGIVYDKQAYFDSIEKVRSLKKRYNAQVIFPHHQGFFGTLKKAPRWYE